MRIVRTAFLFAMAVAVVAGTSKRAEAHAISIGFENAGPGAVTIWLGTYAHGGHHLEGSMRLVGVSGTVFGPVVLPFTMLTPDGLANKPAGLIDGVTNFFASGPLGGSGPLIGFNPFTGSNPNNPGGFILPENHWQGVTFNGLAPGTYQFTYIPIAFPSAEWTPWNNNLNGTFELTRQVVGDVPEPASIAVWSLLLLAGGCVVWLRRRKVMPVA